MIDIKNKFLELTTRTYPHGTEDELFHLLPDFLETDEFGNKFYLIGETTTIFTCHLDTATSANVKVNHVIEGDFIQTDGTTILGADDKAGCVIMLYMIENKVPGLYYFFLGEEVGCVGSRKLSDELKILNTTVESINKIDEDDEDEVTERDIKLKKKEEITKRFGHYKKVISFDRRALSSVITFQSSSRCCSDKFGEALSEQLNRCSKEVFDNDTVFEYKNDPTGIYTDSAQFTSIYPECTNISVGYYSEHHFVERQNIKHLDKLAKTCVLIDWETLPVERDPSVKEYSHSYGNYYGDYDDYYGGDYYGVGYSSQYRRSNTPVVREEKKYFIDRLFGTYASSVTIDKSNNTVKSVDFSTERLSYEKTLIIEFFYHLNVVYRDFTWTGDKAIVFYQENHNFREVSRNEISEFLEELDFWKEEVDKQKNEDIFDCPWAF